jgi:hypothetical protein
MLFTTYVVRRGAERRDADGMSFDCQILVEQKGELSRLGWDSSSYVARD